jgi:hypothetical protein
VAGTSAKTWKPGAKGICIPTIAEEIDMDSMISYKKGVKSYMYGAEIMELTDMEPYQAVAGDSCASDSAAGVTSVMVAPTADPAEIAQAAEDRAVAQGVVDAAKAALAALRANPDVDASIIKSAEEAVARAEGALSTLEKEHEDKGLLSGSAASTCLVNAAALTTALLFAALV